METEINLTKNERKVLSLLIDNARISDSDMASQVKITPQAIRKIRKKLEERYISSYRTVIGYEKIGLRVFAIAHMKLEDKIALADKHIIGAFEINEENLTHILILGFPTLEELDDYKVKVSKYAKVQKIYVVSNKGMLKNSPVELLKSVIE